MFRSEKFHVADYENFRLKAYQWVSQEKIFCVLDSCDYDSDPYGEFELVIVKGARKIFDKQKKSFEELKKFLNRNRQGVFGYFGYDLKNQVENLHSGHPNRLGAKDIFFFIPETLILFRRKNECEIISEENPKIIFGEIKNVKCVMCDVKCEKIKSRIQKANYFRIVKKLRKHIINGDIYEANLCQEFFAKCKIENPLSLFLKLSRISPMPFSAFMRVNSVYAMCTSPERFLKIKNRKIIAQPVKGTIRRGKNINEDEDLKNKLFNSEKDRAENIMIVDLMRNDLHRSCKTKSVHVEKLFEIQTFPNVHQMVSTVSGELRDEIHVADAIKNAFPMGSMTGAPKIKAMELIEKYEKARRGIYSGAIGYFSPDGDANFNVVIRTMLYNEKKKYLSFQAGGAIVYDSDARKEYEEVLLKAKAIFECLT